MWDHLIVIFIIGQSHQKKVIQTQILLLKNDLSFQSSSEIIKRILSI